jgi:hypothetical protein
MPLVTPLGIRIMNDVLSTFEEDGVIRVQGFLGREAIKRHGAKVITCPTASLMRNGLLNYCLPPTYWAAKGL